MPKYKLSTGFSEVLDHSEFNNDEEVWEYLRKILPGKYATLYRSTEIEVPYNDEEKYVPMFNSKYGPKPIGMGPENAILKEIGKPTKKTIWIPVLEGITDYQYSVKK